MGKMKDKFKVNFKSKLDQKEKKAIDPKIVYSLLVAIGLVLGFLVQFYFYRPNFGTFLSSDMDPAGNVYILGVNANDSSYKITKVNSSGNTEFQINLDKSTDKIENTYRYIESDIKGNFYLVKEERNKDAVVADRASYPIIKESVIMYDTNGRYIKEVAYKDFSDDANPPTSPYIRKLQVVDQKITLVGAKNNTYDVITADPLKTESPVQLKSFEIKPEVEQSNKNVEWVNDIAVLSNGRVVYSTKSGKFYAMDNQGSFLDYTDVISRDNTLLTGFNVDAADNLYFTDIMSGNFYKMNTRSLSASNIYKLENEVVPGKDIKIKDLRTIKIVSEDDYYAPSKDFTNPYHIRFGANTLYVNNITGAFFPWGFVIMIAVAILFIGLYFLIKFAIKHNIKRIPLAIKITGLFLPVFLVSMVILLLITANDASREYVTVLRNDQDTGAKIAADHINGDIFSEINHTEDYMSAKYISLKNNLQESYNDIAGKIGDRSDYVVTYFVKNDKIYSTFSNKHNTESGSYNTLRYTDPDMIKSETFLVDYMLERDETEGLYNVWNSLNSEEDIGVPRVNFRDVYGGLSASFAPIKDGQGKVVGFIGNFMDENIHKNAQSQKILQHSTSVVLITAFVIFVYMCLVVKYSLRPIKTLEKSINAMSKGIWNTRVRITSKDEFADIGEAFNLMSEKMDRYTSNLVLLNDIYVKFAPSEIFKLIGKDKITQVDLYDNKVIDMNVLYLTFNISCRDSFNFKSEKELFDALNTSYENFFGVVEKNNGVVHSFGSLGATILFPQSAQDAFNASVQFKEVFINEAIKKNMNMTLGSGEVLIGISGNEKRRGVLVVSDQLMQLFNIDSHLNSLKVNHIATEDIIKSLPQNGICNYRFVGKVGNIQGEGSVRLYEMIDMTNQYKKDLYIITKELFEKAVNMYMNKGFKEARRLFSDVLKINNKDSVAIHYLMKCDEQINSKSDSFNKKEWTGNLFD